VEQTGTTLARPAGGAGRSRPERWEDARASFGNTGENLGPTDVRLRLSALWAVLHHTGRTSGTAYATPVVALATRDGFLIPLPFGDQTQWARNLFAAGGGRLRHRGHLVEIVGPTIVEAGDVGGELPWFARAASRRLGLRQYVRVHRAPVGVARSG